MHTKPYIIGITGGSASGKTSFLHDIKNAFQSTELCIVSQDNYYHPIHKQERDHNGEVNFDLPNSIDRASFFEDIHRLIKGECVQKIEYTFNNPDKIPNTITLNPSPIIVLEGLFVFYYEEIADLCDLKLFIDADEPLKLQRRLLRDAHERGYPESSVIYQWENHVMPTYRTFLEPLKTMADIVIINNKHYKNALSVILSHLNSVLTTNQIH